VSVFAISAGYIFVSAQMSDTIPSLTVKENRNARIADE
jgi:hypothetical protein